MSSGSSKTNQERLTSNQRISFDDEVLPQQLSVDSSIATNSSMVKKPHPRDSKHWQSLVHRESDRWIHSLEELKDRFRSDLDANSSAGKSSIHGGTMAFWSCVAGYCEALATHKETRYEIFPIPIDALKRLARDEFETKILAVARASVEASDAVIKNCSKTENKYQQEVHRIKVRAVANAVWDTAVNSSKKDEEHANSVLHRFVEGRLPRVWVDAVAPDPRSFAPSLSPSRYLPLDLEDYGALRELREHSIKVAVHAIHRQDHVTVLFFF